MKYALVQTSETFEEYCREFTRERFTLVGIYPTIEAAEVERDKYIDKKVFIIIQVW